MAAGSASRIVVALNDHLLYPLNVLENTLVIVVSNVRDIAICVRTEGRRRLPSGVSAFMFLVLAAVSTTACGDRSILAERREPKVILISIDTLRADRLSLYGYHRQTSPYLETFSRDSIVFDHFTNNGGGTLPSHMSMMTSLHPTAHGISPATGNRLEDERVTLAESLMEAGYETGAFVDAGWVSGKFGFDQGFDTYDDDGGHLASIMPKVNWWVNQHLGDPFFLFFHTYDVHSQHERLPYDCPGGYADRYTGGMDVSFDGCRNGMCATELLKWINEGIRRGDLAAFDALSGPEIDFVSALYDGCINYVDAELGRFFDRLKNVGIYDSSLIVVTSDHGEEFFEHGMFLHDQEGWSEQAHIPLIIKLPDSEYGGTRVQHLAAMVDVMPTILGLTGAEVPGDAQGFDLMPTVRIGAPIRSDVHQHRSLRTSRFTIFLDPLRLFDRKDDPGEQIDVLPGEPYLGSVLEDRLLELIEHDRGLRTRFREEHGGESQFVLNPQEVEKLKALGYLQ
jgi:hypothetical protein